MEIKQYKVEKGIATPVNHLETATEGDFYRRKSEGVNWGDFLHEQWHKFEDEKAAYTYATNAPDGVWDADFFSLPVWQTKNGNYGEWFNCLNQEADVINRKEFPLLYRQFLPFNPLPKMETTDLPSPEKAPTCEDKGEYCMGKYKEHCKVCLKTQSTEKGVKTADQFSQLPWYEQIKYIPVAGALCSNGFQELTDKQLETYKNSKVTAAIRYKPQPANNDYAVKVIKERIKELEIDRKNCIDTFNNSHYIKMSDDKISEAKHLIKLLS